MSDTVISVENLSKQYRLGLIGSGTLYEDLNRWWARLRRQPDPTLKIGAASNQQPSANGQQPPESIWALKEE